jgi:hypothetical protein
MCDSWIAKREREREQEREREREREQEQEQEQEREREQEREPENESPSTSTRTTTPVANNWPVLNKAAYYGLAGEVVETLLPHTESDPAALLLQYLASVGNVIGRRPYIRISNANHYPNLFTLIVGRTARSRKGTSAQDIRVIMESAAPDWVRDNIKSGISSGEGIIEKIRDARFKMQKGILVCAAMAVDDKRMLLDEREFSSALSKMKQETNIVSRVLREAWECPQILQTMTKAEPSVATEPFISMVGHITLDELRQLLDKLSITDGFGNRFLYGCVNRSKLLPFGGNFDPVVVDQLGAKTRQAIEAAKTLGQVAVAPEAKELWANIYTDVEQAPLTSGLIDHVTARAAPQTLRLALLYALLDGSPQIAVPHLQAAVALWQFCKASAGYIFNDVSGDQIADTILRELEDVRPDGISRKDFIHDVFARNVRAYDIIAALRKLEAAGKARCQKQAQKGPGRPREMWFAK